MTIRCPKCGSPVETWREGVNGCSDRAACLLRQTPEPKR